MRAIKLIIIAVIMLLPMSSFGMIIGGGDVSLTYVPAAVNLSLEPGSEDIVPIQMTIENPGYRTYSVRLMDSVKGGNMPMSWLSDTSGKDWYMLSRSKPMASAMLRVAVPSGTPPGMYAGEVVSGILGSHSFKNYSFFVNVEVKAFCNEAPTFEILSIEPTTLWAPNHSTQDVKVNGRLILPQGCNLVGVATYAIDDEYDVLDGTGTISVNTAGEFSVSLPVEASRKGSDKDGRLYTITLKAADEKGEGTSAPVNILVPHDMRNK